MILSSLIPDTSTLVSSRNLAAPARDAAPIKAKSSSFERELSQSQAPREPAVREQSASSVADTAEISETVERIERDVPPQIDEAKAPSDPLQSSQNENEVDLVVPEGTSRFLVLPASSVAPASSQIFTTSGEAKSAPQILDQGRVLLKPLATSITSVASATPAASPTKRTGPTLAALTIGLTPTVSSTATSSSTPTAPTPASQTIAPTVSPLPTHSQQTSSEDSSQQTQQDRSQVQVQLPSVNEITSAAAPSFAPEVQPASVTPSAGRLTVELPTGLVAAAPSSGSDEGDDAVNSARITRGLQNAITQRGGSITLRLTPPDMGTVRIHVQITGTSVSAQFHAESPQGHAILSQQMNQLRQSLESQGLQVDRLGVQTMQTSSSSSSQTHQQHDSSQSESRTDDGRSRGAFDDRQQQSRRGPFNPTPQQTFDFEQLLNEDHER